ncbi:hypothetical protein CKO35_15915 [Ectothiorhodospira shaposhnikovii]|nr:hypothetical protein [Ectothiorhodospira shaposhnikovii]
MGRLWQSLILARFALGEDVLEPYKSTIDRWVCPDVMRNQDISVAKAKKAPSPKVGELTHCG